MKEQERRSHSRISNKSSRARKRRGTVAIIKTPTREKYHNKKEMIDLGMGVLRNTVYEKNDPTH